MVNFVDNFWGEKYQGFDVLYHNMKHGQKSCNDFIEYIKERMVVEENYSKQLGKLSRQVAAYPALGSFSPYWNVLRQSTEKDSTLHQQMVLKLQDLLKDIQKYLEEQVRKHKTMKDAEQETSNVVQTIQNLSTALQKAKEAYVARSQETEKLKRESGSAKDIERAEVRLKKAAEDYKVQIEKYSATRQDFEKKMTNSSRHFQVLEEQHLQQMLEFCHTYCRTLEYEQQTLSELCNDMRRETSELTIEKFLSLFIESKSTGTDIPAAVEFEETTTLSPIPQLPSSPTPNLLSFESDESNSWRAPPGTAPILEETTPKKREGFFRSQKGDKKEKENKKAKESKDKKKKGSVLQDGLREQSTTPTIAEDAKSESSFGSQSYDQSTASTVPQIDAEGFVIRNNDNAESSRERSDSNEPYRHESSDSDSEPDEPKKIHVVIKPATIQPNLTGPAGDLDYSLRSQAKALQLGSLNFSYTGGKRATTRMMDMQRSTSMSSGMGANKLNIFDPFAPSGSITESPTSSTANYPIPPQKTGGSVASNPWDSTLDLSVFSQPSGSTQASQMAPPSVNPRTSAFPTIQVPSTTIPLAVAFVEKVSAGFIGADDRKCRTRIEGDLILTFPSSVLQVLLSSPNHPALSFCLTQTSLLENVLPNKHLVTQETQIDDGRITYTFNMANLTSQLRRQTEAKAAPQPYQNIPVMKYHVNSSSGVHVAPLHLVCYWKHEQTHTDMRLDFRRSINCPPLRACQFALTVPPEIEVSGMTSMPNGDWSPHDHTAKWAILSPALERADIKARFEHPPQSRGRVAGPVHCSFQAEGSLLSRVVFELGCEGYKVTVVKMRIVSSRYVCEPEGASS
ncbi:hypothetical protein RvY_07869-2 [Ramazzottius varieornatus]|uniref:F-BAR domain-containing protein n=1 Tax=Ramazzottius varieornatus TaxID=947166 RepID=A0A1D1VD33_RAMVA|nr:hypothetical protein RvY_07869-2 [Ramazzottius varieornatus]